MKLIHTSALALSLLVAGAPLAALAEDTATAHVSGDVQVQSTPGSEGHGPLGALRTFLPPMLHAGVQVRIDEHGSSTEMHGSSTETHHLMASSTNPGMHMGEGMMMGNGDKARARGDGEIDARIANLNKMITRLSQATRLTPDAKTAITAQLTAQITALTNLKTQIDTEGTTTLKTDDQSITKNFRIYALVMPQAAINAAADRIMTIASQMQALSAKIGERITAAQTAGADVSAAVTAHTDFDAKVADAKVQAQAAVTEVAGLKPDNGDATVLASNTATLKDAKTKIDAAQADLKAARKDIGTILGAIHGKGEVKAESSTSST